MRDHGVEKTEEPAGSDPVLDLIARGQTEGFFDPTLSPQWIQHVLWALVYTGIEDVDNGTMSRHGVGSAVIRTLERGIQA
jgi:hypothetical protein